MANIWGQLWIWDSHLCPPVSTDSCDSLQGVKNTEKNWKKKKKSTADFMQPQVTG